MFPMMPPLRIKLDLSDDPKVNNVSRIDTILFYFLLEDSFYQMVAWKTLKQNIKFHICFSLKVNKLMDTEL